MHVLVSYLVAWLVNARLIHVESGARAAITAESWRDECARKTCEQWQDSLVSQNRKWQRQQWSRG